MLYRKLGTTEVEVSVVCLGSMTWGEQNSEANAHQQLDYACAQGVNFIDTAEMYPVPPNETTYGRTETYIGRWLVSRGDRDKLILATKVIGSAEWMSHVRGGRACLDKKNIEQAINASLKRLKTDYIDLYQLHWPDRETNYFGPLGFEYDEDEQATEIEETLQALTGLVASGKVRYIGVSNETPWGTMRYVQLAKRQGYPLIVSIQNPYNLLNRSFEVGLAEVAQRESVGLLAYSPLAFGMLTGKYLNAQRPPNARLTLFERFSRYNNENAWAATQAYVSLAQKYGLDPAQMALSYCHSRPFLTSTIIGATTLAQLKTDIASIDLSLNDAVTDGINKIHQRYPNPAP